MKKSLLSISVLLALAACRQDGSITTPPISDALAEESIMASNKLSNISMDINEITDEALYLKNDGSVKGQDVFALDGSVSPNAASRAKFYLADCGDVQYTLAAGGNRLYKISFGSDATSTNSPGCNNKLNDLYKGVIEFSVARSPGQVTKTITFTNFSVGGKQVTGEITVLKKLLDNNIPEFTHTSKLTIVIGAKTYQVNGTRTVFMNEGYTTPQDYSDDVFRITGRNDFNNLTDNRRWSMEIIKPIWRVNSCTESLGFPVEGTKRFNFNAKTFELDYGLRKDCDNKATITLGNGTIKNIVLTK
jgi:hypothetical protein